VEHERVAVGILEPRLLADAGDDRLALEDDALRLELGAGGWPMLAGSKTSSVTWPQRSSMSLSPSDSTSSPSTST
jgi:hypothetical protein